MWFKIAAFLFCRESVLGSDVKAPTTLFFSGYVLLKLFHRLTLPVECVGFIGFPTQTCVHGISALHPFLWICVIDIVGLHFVTHTCFGGEGESYVEARGIHFHQFLTLPRYYYSPLKPALLCIGDARVFLLLFQLLVELYCAVFVPLLYCYWLCVLCFILRCVNIVSYFV